MPTKVYLVGPMGAGKSTVARGLAAQLGTELLDLDEWIVRQAGMSVPEIFAAEGEAGFRDREEAALAGVASAEEALVVATGGGAVLREANRRRMAESGAVVYLSADVDTLLARAGGDPERPLLQVPDPRARLAELQAERDPLYRQAHLTVDTTGRRSEEVVAEIRDWLEARSA